MLAMFVASELGQRRIVHRAGTGPDFSGFGFRARVKLGLRNTLLSGAVSLKLVHIKSFLCNF